MSEEDMLLRWWLLAAPRRAPIIAYYRIKTHRTGESLDRCQRGY